MQGTLILMLSAAYIGLLFAVAYYGDERAERGRSVVANPYIYALSLAVYCTAWTFYGSVGRAATTGVGFLPIYLGPTLMAPLGWLVLRKMIRISKHHRITSIADFIGSRYGKSARLAGVVTVIAVLGIVPYIALQLKAISTSFTVLMEYPDAQSDPASVPFFADTALYAALLLAAFTILFGTRHLDVTERHEGIVAAIAFESVVKLAAFVAVGLFVTYGLYDGFGDLFAAGQAEASIRALFTMESGSGGYSEWAWLTGLSMMAILFLPRQFQVAVVENVDEAHLKKAIWLFPLYLLLINLFVLPIAVAGLMVLPEAANADTFVLTLPLSQGYETLAVAAFLGGVSAATGMVIVAATALSTMISNDLILPLLLRSAAFQQARRTRVTGLLLGIRRASIVGVLLLGYGYLDLIGEQYPLVSIGLISFAAVAQFAPAMLGGMFWRRGTWAGALSGLLGGVLIWLYTLPLPTLVEAGWVAPSLMEEGPFGLAWLRPDGLLGLTDLGLIPHALFWSLLINTGLYVGVSLFTGQSAVERSQALAFVDAFRYAERAGGPMWRGTAPVAELKHLLQRFLGWRRTERAFELYARKHDLTIEPNAIADEQLVSYAERVLAGAIGAASSRAVISSVVQEKPLQIGEVMDILDEAQQVMAYSRELEHKKAELQRATRELRATNQQLKELDRMKDDFISTVTHELRTPLTSIRAISEILQANPDLQAPRREEFLATVIAESERLSRLVEQVLDLQRLEAHPLSAATEPVAVEAVLADAASAMRQQIERDDIQFELEGLDQHCFVRGDRDRLMQVVLNLLSNAAKFCDDRDGRIRLHLARTDDTVQIAVEDNGPGIDPDDQEIIFQRFRRIRQRSSPHMGSGLGLHIVQRIIREHQGRIEIDSQPGEGTTFTVVLTRLPAGNREDASGADATHESLESANTD